MSLIERQSILSIIFIIILISSQLTTAKRSERSSSSRAGRKLIVFLINGFAHSWTREEHRFNLSGFSQLRHNGVRASHLRPEFPTLSLPNQYSLMTGLHVEKHGLVGDIMYDTRTRTYFLNGTHRGDWDPRWWNESEPVWMEAGKQGLPTKLFWWRGCQVPFHLHHHQQQHDHRGRNIQCVPFDDSLSTDSLPSHIDHIVRELKNDQLRLVLINYEMLDLASHRNGPYSADVTHYIRRVSGILDELQHALTRERLWSSTNLMVVSDHGQLAVKLDSVVHFVDDFLEDTSMIEASANDGAFMMLYPVPGKQHQVYHELHKAIPNVAVYMVSDLAKMPHWNLASASRISPIVLVAEPGFAIYRRNRFQSYSELPLSLHGYDNNLAAMRGIFYARGADFKHHHHHEWLRIVDVYQLICHVLSIKCHEHDGSWERVADMLTEGAYHSSVQSASSSSSILERSIASSIVMVVSFLHWRN